MSEMAVSVRPAGASDGGDIARLTSQLGYDVAKDVVEARLTRILVRPDARFLVAERDGRVVGWVHAAAAEYVEAEAFVMIAGLVVDRDHRRMGIGRLLMQHAERWAREQGFSIVRLWSTSTRATAHRFYEGLGYRNIKTQYSFARSLDPAAQDALEAFVPRVDEAG